jgi:hypothetical protein
VVFGLTDRAFDAFSISVHIKCSSGTVKTGLDAFAVVRQVLTREAFYKPDETFSKASKERYSMRMSLTRNFGGLLADGVEQQPRYSIQDKQRILV